jgi:hypothetical protein
VRRLLTLALLLFVVTTAGAAEEPATGVVQRVAAATEAFRTASATESKEERTAAYARSAALYRAALDGGPRNGALEYNAGNAWFLSGDVGRAIVHYRRALLLRPGDARVETNLETARAERRDRFEATSSRALTDTLLFWHHGLSLRGKIPFALAAWTLGFLLLAVSRWLPPGRPGRAGARRSGLLLLVVALVLGLSALLELRERDSRTGAVVVVPRVVLRTGDGMSYPQRYENPIHSGAEVRVVEERAGWVDVELPDGKRGWLPVDALERV